MAHYEHSGGETAMHVEHFNPHLPPARRNAYENLFLATSSCNGRKLDFWPTKEEQAQGIRYLNPCEEHDYGVHIFEDPDTFQVWGATPAGKYQVRMMRLNAGHLINERKMRHELNRALGENAYLEFVGDFNRDGSGVVGGIEWAKSYLKHAILPICQKRKPTSKATELTQ